MTYKHVKNNLFKTLSEQFFYSQKSSLDTPGQNLLKHEHNKYSVLDYTSSHKQNSQLGSHMTRPFFYVLKLQPP